MISWLVLFAIIVFILVSRGGGSAMPVSEDGGDGSEDSGSEVDISDDVFTYVRDNTAWTATWTGLDFDGNYTLEIGVLNDLEHRTVVASGGTISISGTFEEFGVEKGQVLTVRVEMQLPDGSPYYGGGHRYSIPNDIVETVTPEIIVPDQLLQVAAPFFDAVNVPPSSVGEITLGPATVSGGPKTVPEYRWNESVFSGGVWFVWPEPYKLYISGTAYVGEPATSGYRKAWLNWAPGTNYVAHTIRVVNPEVTTGTQFVLPSQTQACLAFILED